MSKKLWTMLVAVFLAGCNAKLNNGQYTYHYSLNGSDTGEHSFESKTAMCEALKDETLNNGSAWSLRAERYKADCGGTMSLYSTPQAFNANTFFQQHAYDFSENGCDTGKHEFNSRREMCAALKNDELNRDCAPQMRGEYFQSQCGSN